MSALPVPNSTIGWTVSCHFPLFLTNQTKKTKARKHLPWQGEWNRFKNRLVGQGDRENEFKSLPLNALGHRLEPIELGKRRRIFRRSSASWEVGVEEEVWERNADSMASSSSSCCCVIGWSQSHSGTEKMDGDGDEEEGWSLVSISKVDQWREFVCREDVWRFGEGLGRPNHKWKARSRVGFVALCFRIVLPPRGVRILRFELVYG